MVADHLQPALLLRAEHPPGGLLFRHPKIEPDSDDILMGHELLVVFEGVANQRDNVGEHPAALAANLGGVERLICLPELLRGEVHGWRFDRAGELADVQEAEPAAAWLLEVSADRHVLIPVLGQELLEGLHRVLSLAGVGEPGEEHLVLGGQVNDLLSLHLDVQQPLPDLRVGQRGEGGVDELLARLLDLLIGRVAVLGDAGGGGLSLVGGVAGEDQLTGELGEVRAGGQ